MKDNVEVVRFLHELKETNETSTPSHRVVEFCAVRPSDMDGEESPHEAHAELQNGLFDAVKHDAGERGAFIADLVTKPETWARWRNAFPHCSTRSSKRRARRPVGRSSRVAASASFFCKSLV